MSRPFSIICAECKKEYPVGQSGPIPKHCYKCADKLYSKNRRALGIDKDKYYLHDKKPNGKYQKKLLPDGFIKSLLENQNNSCAICKKPFNLYSKRRDFDIDHDHITKKVRALLCHRCNIKTGYTEKEMGVQERLDAIMRGDEF